MIRTWRIIILALCLCATAAWAEEEQSETELPADEPARFDLYPSAFSQVDGALRDFNRPTKHTLALELGPKLLELRASYWEKRQAASLPLAPTTDSTGEKWGSYFDLLARSAQFEGKLVGETEVAYSATGLSSSTEEQPLMTRLGLNGKWGKSGYGVAYRSFGRGFLPLNGTRIEHDREESQFWGEYDFGLFRLRGAGVETRERDSLNQQLTLTRTAATSFHITKPTWSMLLSSSYSTIDRRHPTAATSLAFANGLAVIYRPVNLLTLEPNLNFKQEWEPGGGLKIDTPSAGFSLAYMPMRDMQLIGRASFSRSLSEDPIHDASIVNTTAGLNWKLGKTSLGDQSLSLRVEYKNESHPALADNQHANLTGMIQFKIAGF